MMNLIAWIILGILTGAIAKAIYPDPEGGGISGTITLGIIGGLIGGSLVAYLKTGTILATTLNVAGLVFAALCAMIAIFIWGLISRKRITQ